MLHYYAGLKTIYEESHGPVDADSPRRWGSREVELTAVELVDGAGNQTATFRTGGPRPPTRGPVP